jgi:succinoglycan biosynthesis transport protein ExoP
MPYDSPIPDEPVLLRALHMLRRRWVLAVVVFGSVLAAAMAFALSLPDLYRASAVVLVERRLQDAFVKADGSDEVESRLLMIKQEVLSRARLTDLVTRFDLYPDLRVPGDMGAALEQVRRDIRLDRTGPEQVSSLGRTIAFNLTFTGSSPTSVAEVSNAVAAFYVAQNHQMRSEEAARATQFLEAQMKEVRAQLDQNENQVEAYTTRHAGELPQQVEVNLATLERLNTQLRLNGEQQMRALDQRDKLFDARGAPPVIRVPEGASPETIRLARLKVDLAQLEGFPDKYPDVRRLKDEISVLEKDAEARRSLAPAVGTAPAARGATVRASNGARTIEGLDADLTSLKAGEATLRQTIATVERRLESVPYRQNQFASLSRNHEATRAQYESLRKEYETAQLAQSVETSNQGDRFRIMEAAVPPTGPSGPNRLRLLILGLFAAAFAASVVVLLLEQFDTSFHSIDELRRFSSVPVLVAIPHIGRPAATNWPRSALLSASVIVGVMLVGLLAAYVAHDNASLARLLVRVG